MRVFASLLAFIAIASSCLAELTLKDMESLKVDGFSLGMKWEDLQKTPEGQRLKLIRDTRDGKAIYPAGPDYRVYRLQADTDPPAVQKKLGAKSVTRRFVSGAIFFVIGNVDGTERIVGIGSATTLDKTKSHLTEPSMDVMVKHVSKTIGESKMTIGQSGLEVQWDTRNTGVTALGMMKEMPNSSDDFYFLFTLFYDNYDNVFLTTDSKYVIRGGISKE